MIVYEGLKRVHRASPLLLISLRQCLSTKKCSLRFPFMLPVVPGIFTSSIALEVVYP